jgi:hypothetical protein
MPVNQSHDTRAHTHTHSQVNRTSVIGSKPLVLITMKTFASVYTCLPTLLRILVTNSWLSIKISFSRTLLLDASQKKIVCWKNSRTFAFQDDIAVENLLNWLLRALSVREKCDFPWQREQVVNCSVKIVWNRRRRERKTRKKKKKYALWFREKIYFVKSVWWKKKEIYN